MIPLDTHAVLWLAQLPELVSKEAKEAITSERQKDGVAISDTTLWELAMLISKGKVGVHTSLRDFLEEVERFCGTPRDERNCRAVCAVFQEIPGDPTDRLIGATAIVHGIDLVTKDKGIRKSGEVKCIW